MIHKKRCIFTKQFKAFQPSGPHNEEVISFLVGNLLGESWGEKRGHASRFHLHISSRNVEYLHWFHQFFSLRGYCSPKKPKKFKQIGKKGKIYWSSKIRTWSFSSLTWLFENFYHFENGKWVKKIPENIEVLLTAKALAIWIMNDGGASSAGLRLATQGWKKQDVERLQNALKSNFGFITTLEKSQVNWALSFPKDQCHTLFSLVDPYIVDCMRSKFKNCSSSFSFSCFKKEKSSQV